MGRECPECGADQPDVIDACTQCGAGFDRDDFDLVTAQPETSVTLEHRETGETRTGYADESAIVREHNSDRETDTFSQGVWRIQEDTDE